MYLVLSAALDDLDNKRDALYQKVKAAVEAYKTEVIQNQHKYLKEAQEKKNIIETRKVVMMECFKETDQFMNNENPIDIIHYSRDILLSVEESVMVDEGLNSFPSYETKLFEPQNHDNFIEQVVGKIVTEEKMTNMPGLATWKMPVKGTLVKSWQTMYEGVSIAGGVAGDMHAVTRGAYNQGVYPYYLETFDQEGNQKKYVAIGQHYNVRGLLVSAHINGMDMIILSTSDPYSIQIRQIHDGKLIDSLPLNGFNPADNAICMTPNNNILVCSTNGKVMEFEVRNMKIVQTQKILNFPVQYVAGLCHVTHDNRQLVIATSYNKQIIAVDYHTGDVVWKKDNPVWEGIPITPVGITHDGAGHLFISDFDNKRICIMTPDGEIHHSLLQNTNAADFCHQAWFTNQRRLVVKDGSKGLYLYTISYEEN